MDNNLQEINKLIAIIEATVDDTSTSQKIFSQSLQKLDALKIDSSLNSLELELELEAVSINFRKLWLNYCTQNTSSHFRSPFYDESIQLVNSKSISYDYERVSSTKVLDNALLKHLPSLKQWDTDCTFFSSGMSAIHIVLSQLFIYIKQEDIDIPHVSVAKGSYFETIALFRFLKRQGGFDISYSSFEEILNNLKNNVSNIIFLEPVLCDLHQTTINFDLLIDACNQRDDTKLLFIVIDTSIVGLSFEISYILDKLILKNNIVFIDVSSGLKLYQEGLEFTNVGFSKIYTLKEDFASNQSFTKDASEIKKQFGRLRKVYGVGLSLEQFSILDTQWFLNSKNSRQYMNTLHSNNHFIAKQIAKQQGIFKDVFHPQLSTSSHFRWAQSPFIILAFNENDDTQINMEFIKKVILHEAANSKITLYWGTSFGFRHHRFEILELFNEEYLSGKSRHVIRLCIGHRQGFSMERTLSIFLKLANFTSFEELNVHYKSKIVQ